MTLAKAEVLLGPGVVEDRSLYVAVAVEPGSTLRLRATIAGGPQLGPNRALMQFDFGRVSARSLDFAKLGLSVSSHRGVGLYRYLKTGPGRLTTFVEIPVPEGCRKLRVGIRSWHADDRLQLVELARLEVETMSTGPVIRAVQPPRTVAAPTVAAERVGKEERARPLGFVSFDIEALPGRAPDDFVSRLIWGRTPRGDFGIERLCSALRQHRLKGNFMVDLSGCLTHGETAIRRVTDFLLEQGHDVQVHLHSEWVLRGWGLFRDVRHPIGMHELDGRLSRAILDWSAVRFRRLTGRDPIAFRSGGCHFNRSTVEAALQTGYRCLSNFNAVRHQSMWTLSGIPAANEPFDWGGMVEIPYDLAPEPLSISMDMVQGAWDRVLARKATGRQTFNVLLHSWSLLARNEQGMHLKFDPAYEDRLHQILELVASNTRCTTYAEYVSGAPTLPCVKGSVCTADVLGMQEEVVECRDCHSVYAPKDGERGCPSCSS